MKQLYIELKKRVEYLEKQEKTDEIKGRIKEANFIIDRISKQFIEYVF